MAEKAAQKRGKSFIQGTFLNLGRLFISLFIPNILGGHKLHLNFPNSCLYFQPQG